MNRKQAETLVRVGRGTAMGNVLRRYWIPALLSRELSEPDCPQVRVKLLGEELLAFRDSDGRLGMVSEHCPHRGASLFLGRNEECGIRCSFHGWKFDVDGACVELPQQPSYARKIRLTSYPCIERGDIIWTYMGPPESRPAPPEYEWAMLPPAHRYVSKWLQQCNYLQAMEGGIDTTHASWVHRFEMERDPLHHKGVADQLLRADPNPVFDVQRADHGMTIFARRTASEREYYWRITQWIMPWYTLIPPFGPHPIGGHIWVPIDDETCWTWSINFYPEKPLNDDERASMQAGKGIHVTYVPGSFLPTANRENDWLIDRAAQKRKETFSGVAGFSIQDVSLQESMGPIQDRTKEHLIPTDMAIIEARKILLEAAEGTHAIRNEPLPALDPRHHRVRPASAVLANDIAVRTWAQEWLVAETGRPVYSV